MLLNFVESVSHDWDKHIQHDHHDKESTEQKQDIADDFISCSYKAISVKITEPISVGEQKGLQDIVAWEWFQDSLFKAFFNFLNS